MQPCRILSLYVAVCTFVAANGFSRGDERPAAQPARAAGGAATSVHKSRNFILYTDLSLDDAEETLTRMEATLEFASQYWRRPSRGKIDCYLVHDLENWPDAALPHRLARVFVGGIGGVTIDGTVSDVRMARNKATVYASTRPGVVEHEVVHAYCCQTFGFAGPDWYKEGMAEMVLYRREGEKGVHCPAEIVESLRVGKAPHLSEIVGGGRITGRIGQSLDAMLAHPKNKNRHVPLTDWTERDAENVQRAKERYLWSWALCHMLLHNPNYSVRFRALGDGYLANRDESFERWFSPMHEEINFEYAWFLRHIGVGFRVDLCSWDWQKRFLSLDQCRSVRVRVLAARGYQASGLSVSRGRRYAYQAVGSWVTSAEGAETDAHGHADGAGKLVGVVMKDFQLSEPIELGADGTFVAPTDGKLYLRCRDTWTQLSDNQGQVVVQLTRPASNLR